MNINWSTGQPNEKMAWRAYPRGCIVDVTNRPR